MGASLDGGAGQGDADQGSLIAAAALAHDLAVVTRNRNDFEAAGVRVIDPFA